MVQLVVKLGGNSAEWGLVELQGHLETRDQIPFNNMHVGDLHFDSRGAPSLVVGHHLLTGKVMELEKPFAILKKKYKMYVSAPGTVVGRSHEVEREEECTLEGEEVEWGTRMGLQTSTTTKLDTEYEVVALITRKIIFKNRPKPIITKPLPRKM